MFDDLYDAVSRLWSWRWPREMGEVTAVDVEITERNGGFRLAVAYKFSTNGDGPYTGESFWNPAFRVNPRVLAARRKIRVGHPVLVRYRSDDPSVNTLDRSVWQSLEKV
jgi:hypothetical protein